LKIIRLIQDIDYHNYSHHGQENLNHHMKCRRNRSDGGSSLSKHSWTSVTFLRIVLILQPGTGWGNFPRSRQRNLNVWFGSHRAVI
jgi:hypothetical protein